MNMKTLTETSTFRVLSLLLCFCFFIPAMNVSASSLQADKFKVSGIVKDVTGEPVIGVNVSVQGTGNGSITDLDGKFAIPNVKEKDVLIVSYIGYLTQSIPVGKQTSFTITLKEDAQALDEVVVVGYGVQKKRDLSGAVSP